MTCTATTGAVLASLRPVAGVADSQEPPDSVEVDAVQFKAPTPTLSTLKDWAGGAPPPAAARNVRPDWESPILCCVLVIDRITGTSKRSLPGEKTTLTMPT